MDQIKDQIERISAPDREIPYPRQLVGQLQQTSKGRLMLRGQTPLLMERSADTPQLRDFCKIMNFSYAAKSNQGSIDVVLSIVNPANAITMTGVLLDLSNETCLGELTPVQGSGSHCELSCSFTLDHPPEKPESLAVLVNADWINSDGETEISMLHENEEDLLGDTTYEHLRPKKETTPQRVGTEFLDRPPYDHASREISSDTKPIILAFKRAPEAQADVDYICGFGTVRDDHPNFGVPGRGILSMEGGSIVMDGTQAPRAVCSVFRADGGGGVETDYTIQYPETVFTDEGGALHYDMVTGWNLRYNEPGNLKKVLFDYQLDITAYFKVNTLTKKVTWTVTSRSQNIAASNVTVIPQLQIMWGCLAKGTLIDWPGQPPCRIEDILIGTRVSGWNGTEMLVTNVWHGEADKMVSLTPKQGHGLLLTENHPVLTPEGWRCAASLTPGMAVLDRDGQAVEIQEASVIPYTGDVYNLDLAPVSGEDRLEDHVMLAEGLCVSDHRGQNELNCASEEEGHG